MKVVDQKKTMSDSFDDNLVQFLNRFTRFSIGQCSEFAQQLTIHPRSIGNISAIEKQRVIPFIHSFFSSIQDIFLQDSTLQ